MAPRAILAAAAGIIAFALVLIATEPPGPGLDPDAASYLGAAVSLVRHGSYRVPVTPWTAVDTTGLLAHFPPGFPTAIAGPIAVGLSPIQAARLIIALAAFATAVLLVLLIDGPAALVAIVLVGVTPAITTVHLSVLSEPLFLALMLATMLACLARRPGVTGILAAAAVMVRYVGLSLTAATVIWFLRQPGSWRRRVQQAALAGLPSLVLLGAWVMRSSREAGPTSIRELGIYGSVSQTVGEGVSTVGDWLAPASQGKSWRAAAVVVVIVAIGAVAVGAWRALGKKRDARQVDTIALAGIVGGLYLVMLVVSRVAADPNIPFDERLLAPAILVAEIALAIGAMSWRPSWTPAKWVRVAVAGVAIVWVGASAAVSASRVRDALADGGDFASSDWRFSPTLAWVRANADGAALYTNWPAALYFHAGRNAHEVPRRLDPLTLRRFGDRLARLHGIMIAFDAPNADAAPPDSIASRLRLRQLARLADGAVWGPP